MRNFKFIGVEIRVEELQRSSLQFWAWISALLLVIVLGLYAWHYQLPWFSGLIITGMRDVFAWGLYIQNFLLFVGLAAGGLVVYASIELFGATQFRPMARLAVLQALVCVIMALMCVMVDLGNPQRVYYMLLTPNFRSIFVFDAAILSIYGILCTIDLWMLTSGRGGTPLAFALTVISLPAAIGIHTITAWILGLVKARETWHTALMAPIFLSSAIASGVALLIVMVLMIRRYTDMKFKDEMFYSLGKLMAMVVFVDLFFLLCELVTTFWPHAAMPGHTERIGILTSGPLAPLLFSEIFIFGIVPFILTAIPRTRKSIPILTLASIFVVVGIFLKRFVLLAMGVAFSPLGHLGFYLPTLPEISITAMIWATGFLIITLGVKLLPMEVPEEGH